MKNLDIIIEIPKKSRIKYEKDETSNRIRCDRYLKTPFVYPFNYGYIPNTLAPDNDALDVFVLTDEKLYPGVIISVEVIGVFKMIDNGESDDKIIAIPSPKLNFPNKFTEIKNNEKIIKAEFLEEIKFFLENYKKLENKKVEITGYENKQAALDIILTYQIIQ